MAFADKTRLRFNFVLSQATFNSLVSTSELTPGHLYFVGNIIYLALTTSTHRVFGGMTIGVPPVNANDAEEGLFYYNPATGVLQIVINRAGTLEWAYITQSLISISPGTGANAGSFVVTRMDGTTTVLPLPKVNTIDENRKSETDLVTERALVEFVADKFGALIGGVVFKGPLPESHPDGAEAGWLFKVASPAVYEGQEVHPGDWVIYSGPTTFHIFRGVELPAIDNLTSTDALSPLAANQGRVLDEKKVDKMTDAVGGKLVFSLVGGGIVESDVEITTSMDMDNPSNTKVPTEKAVADQLAEMEVSIGDMALEWIVTP